MAALTIFLMVAPPLCDTFDTWDKTPELPVVGHNTETTVASMALDLGMGLAVAWTAVLLLNWLTALFAPFIEKLRTPGPPQVRATDYLLLLFSPPLEITILRI